MSTEDEGTAWKLPFAAEVITGVWPTKEPLFGELAEEVKERLIASVARYMTTVDRNYPLPEELQEIRGDLLDYIDGFCDGVVASFEDKTKH